MSSDKDERKNNEPLTSGFVQAGQTEEKSAVNRCCTASGLDGILLDISC
jgi:hypothetical protein